MSGSSTHPVGTKAFQCPPDCPLAIQLEGIMETVVDKAVRTTLLQLGIDTTSPIEMQRDMQYLRGWRQNAQVVRGKAVSAIVGAIIAAALLIGALGLRSWADSTHRHVPVSTPTAAK